MEPGKILFNGLQIFISKGAVGLGHTRKDIIFARYSPTKQEPEIIQAMLQHEPKASETRDVPFTENATILRHLNSSDAPGSADSEMFRATEARGLLFGSVLKDTTYSSTAAQCGYSEV